MPYTVEWTEVSSHMVQVSDEEMARIKGISVAQLKNLNGDELWEGLEDQLAELEDDGFEGLEREIDDVTEH